MNFFGYRTAAERYTHGRPYFHPLVIRRVKEVLSLTAPLSRALDVGCGTGLSTVALRELVSSVVGVDASPHMLSYAPKCAGVAYCIAVAENLPFGADAFDLTTVSQVVHWVRKESFFAEARRTLRAGGCLIIYDNYFSGRMEWNAAFQRWHQEVYLRKYPSPPREWAEFSADETEKAGFRLLGHERLHNTISFTPAGLTAFFVTQSNIIATVEGGVEDIRAVTKWLKEEVRALFAGARKASFLFDAPVWYLQRIV